MPVSFFKRGFANLQNVSSLNKLEQRFEAHLRSMNDEIALVLKSHLYVERLIQEILTQYFGKTTKIFRDKQAVFDQALRLVRVTNITEPALTEALGYLNDIRNGLAHTFSSLSNQIDSLEGERKSFKNSCSALKVTGINQFSDRDLFIKWVSKIYVELTKSTYIAAEMRSVMLKPDFTNLFQPSDVSKALSDPMHIF